MMDRYGLILYSIVKLNEASVSQPVIRFSINMSSCITTNDYCIFLAKAIGSVSAVYSRFLLKHVIRI